MHTLRLPRVHGPATAPTGQAMPPQAAEFVSLWLARLGDRAKLMTRDDRLTRAAQKHAEYLTARTGAQLEQSMHIGRDGSHSNQRVIEAGYRLPDYFDADANHVESCARNSRGAAVTLDALLNSPPHRAHLLGEGWFAGHVVWGVGQHGADWVIVICPVEQG